MILGAILNKIKQPIRKIAMTVAVLAAMAGIANAYTISGKVRNLNGLTTGPTIENAIVDIDNGAFTTNTNSSGDYSISGVPSGTYNIVVKKSGFRSINEQNYSLNADTTFNACIPESLITTEMGTGVLDMNHMLEMWSEGGPDYGEPLRWRNFPILTFLSNANAEDTTAFHRDLSAGTGNWQDSDTSSVEKRQGYAMYVLTSDSIAAADHGYIIRFGETVNSTNPVENSADLGYIKYARTKINGHNPGAITLPHEGAGFALGKIYVYSFISNMNMAASEWQPEDNILTAVQRWHELAKQRGEQNAHLIYYSNASGVAGNPPEMINSPFHGMGLSNYPNPAREYTNIRFNLSNNEKASLCLYNISGQRVYQCSFFGMAGLNRRAINVKSLPSGVYMISVEAGRQRAFEKITIVN